MYGKSWKKVGYKTQDPETHLDYDKPIKVKVTKFVPGKDFYIPKKKNLRIPELLKQECYLEYGVEMIENF